VQVPVDSSSAELALFLLLLRLKEKRLLADGDFFFFSASVLIPPRVLASVSSLRPCFPSPTLNDSLPNAPKLMALERTTPSTKSPPFWTARDWEGGWSKNLVSYVVYRYAHV
jgi:hypothetical protein